LGATTRAADVTRLQLGHSTQQASVPSACRQAPVCNASVYLQPCEPESDRRPKAIAGDPYRGTGQVMRPLRQVDRPDSHAGEGIVTKVSPWSVADTVSRLSALVTAKGLKLFAVIDQSREAKDVGLELRDTTLVIFGSPQAGTPVMVAAPLAALDLPLKVLVWADGDQTKISYTAPSALAARYDLSDELAGVDAVTDAVIAA